MDGGRGFFIFIFFIFVFYKNIFDLEIYMNIPRPPRCRAAGTWPPGSRAAGAYLQKKVDKKLRRGPWRTGRPAEERQAVAARLRGDRPPTLYKVLVVPHPLICLTKNLEKKREGAAKACRIFKPAGN